MDNQGRYQSGSVSHFRKALFICSEGQVLRYMNAADNFSVSRRYAFSALPCPLNFSQRQSGQQPARIAVRRAAPTAVAKHRARSVAKQSEDLITEADQSAVP